MNGKKFVLSTALSTPNGPLHLGHIAGPYLHTDIYRRCLEREGAEVLALGGLDTYELHVQSAAIARSVEPRDLTLENGRAIASALQRFAVHYDHWLDLSTAVGSRSWRQFITEISAELHHRGTLIDKEETVLWQGDIPQIGPWRKGACCLCGEAYTGFCCENCGYLNNSIADSSRAALNVRQTRTSFLSFASAWPQLNCIQGRRFAQESDKLRAKFATNPLLRLTLPGNFGLPARDFRLGEGVLFSYNWVFPTIVFAAKEICQQAGWNEIPFAADSPIHTTSFFGSDSAYVRSVAAPLWTRVIPGWRSFDQHVQNEFYLLDGLKFSTSRKHAIWALDDKFENEFEAECCRRFIAMTGPTFVKTSFSLQTFYAWRDKWKLFWQRINDFADSCQTFGGPANSPTGDSCRQALKQQLEACLSADFSIQALESTLATWEARWWADSRTGAEVEPSSVSIQGWALLAYPLMPRLSRSVWERVAPHQPLRTSSLFPA
jgi:methionyl-tRNA synthetase